MYLYVNGTWMILLIYTHVLLICLIIYPYIFLGLDPSPPPLRIESALTYRNDTRVYETCLIDMRVYETCLIIARVWFSYVKALSTHLCMNSTYMIYTCMRIWREMILHIYMNVSSSHMCGLVESWHCHYTSI